MTEPRPTASEVRLWLNGSFHPAPSWEERLGTAYLELLAEHECMKQALDLHLDKRLTAALDLIRHQIERNNKR